MSIPSIGLLPLLGLLLLGCGRKEEVSIQSQGRQLCDLPRAVGAPLFEPEGHRYAELVRQDDKWLGFMDGKAAEVLETEEEIMEFGERFKDKMDREGLVPRVLISADREMPMDGIRMPVRGLAASGVTFYHFQVQQSEGSEVHAPLLDLRMEAMFGSAHPLLIEVGADGVIRDVSGRWGVVLDEPQAGETLPGLSRALERRREEARGVNLRPGLQAVFKEGASYQRFVDVLNCARRHDAHFGVVDAIGSTDEH